MIINLEEVLQNIEDMPCNLINKATSWVTFLDKLSTELGVTLPPPHISGLYNTIFLSWNNTTIIISTRVIYNLYNFKSSYPLTYTGTMNRDNMVKFILATGNQDQLDNT